MKWRPTATEKAWIRKDAAERVNRRTGQVTLDARIQDAVVPWAEFVRSGLDLSMAKSVTFDVIEVSGFGKTRSRGPTLGSIRVHVKNSNPPKVVYIT